jgi:glutamate---cysteine ligase / carboxylate-amine ligase
VNASTFDRDRARETFEVSTDFTVGLEEEFALLDPATLSLTNAFEGVKEASEADDALADSVAGELISSEIEIRSGRGDDFADALERQRERRRRLFALAADQRVALGATGLHPWSPWQEQRIIDTPHYRRVEEGLKYVAWRNNAFSIHVHVGMRGADRAVAVCDTVRPLLPTMLAASANSAFTEALFTGLHSARTQIFTRMFPRCGVPDFYGSWDSYADYVDMLFATRSIAEHTQIWWSVRPHLEFGTVEVRIMDAQTRAEESTALLALATACAAQAGFDYELGRRPSAVPARLIEENLWRAIRYGMDGSLIDADTMREVPARAAVEGLLDWARDARADLKLDSHLEALERMLDAGNGAQRQWRRHEAGEPIREIYADGVAETCATFAETPAGAGVCAGVAG